MHIFWHTAAQATFNRWCKSKQSDAFHCTSWCEAAMAWKIGNAKRT